MIKINPYLNFLGNTEEAFLFYQSVFKGEFLGGIFRFKDTPEAPQLPAEDQSKIMHIALPVGNNLLMGTDALESAGHTVSMGNNITLSVEVDDKSEADRIFNGLAAGGKATMPLQETFWSPYFGMLEDKFGIQWMISLAEKK